MRRIAIATLIALVIVTAQHGVAIAQLYGNRLASKDGKWLLPVASLHLTSTERDHINRRSVQAWDITAPQGTPIFPIEDGVVEYAGCNNSGGYGCWTLIRHDSGVKTIMGHMVNGSITVKAGQRVSQWDVVGQVGWTGKTSFGPHVHLEIHKPNGGRYNVSDFWDITKMHYQKLGNAQSSEVITEIGIAGSAAAQQQPAPAATESRLTAILRTVVQMPVEQLSSAVFTLSLAVGLILWLGGMWLRIVIVSAGSAMVGTALVAMLLMPVAPTIQASQQAPVIGGDTWEVAFAQMRKWEGSKCTHDPVRTYKGVTNASYNAWRQTKGMGAGDVCRDMSDEQMQQIYYERYWLASGADRITSKALAITHFDMAVNAGTGAAEKILSQCGNDVNCYNNAREQFYRSAKGCYLYCAGWLNRLNDIRRLTQIIN